MKRFNSIIVDKYPVIVKIDTNVRRLWSLGYDKCHIETFFYKNFDFSSFVGSRQLSFLPYHLYLFLAT